MDIQLTRTIELLIYPPASSLLLALLGTLLLMVKRGRLGRLLISAGLITLYFGSIPFTTELLTDYLERDPPLTEARVKASGAQAIVVLGGGRYRKAPEYGYTDVSGGRETDRLRYAAFLQRRTGLPILTAGGDPLGEGTPGAELMKISLEQEFHVPVRWADGRSLHTFDNAKYAHEILTASGIERILLVTHAWHMPRARRAFEQSGLIVTPAPTTYTTPGPLEQGALAWLPSSSALQRNNTALHELIGMVWYRLFREG